MMCPGQFKQVQSTLKTKSPSVLGYPAIIAITQYTIVSHPRAPNRLAVPRDWWCRKGGDVCPGPGIVGVGAIRESVDAFSFNQGENGRHSRIGTRVMRLT